MVACRAVNASCISWGSFPCSTRAQPQGGCVKNGGTKQIVLSLSKQCTDTQGWVAAELAPRVAARRWLQHRAGVCRSARRAPSDAHSGTRRIASCGPDCQLILRGSSAFEWNTRRHDPSFLHDSTGEKSLPLRAFTSGFLTGWNLAENLLVGRPRHRLGDDTRGQPQERKHQTSRKL